MGTLLPILYQLLDLYSWVIIISALISWFPIPRDNPLVVGLRQITEPVYEPIRAVLDPSKTGGIDLSPLIILFALSLARQAIAQSM